MSVETPATMLRHARFAKGWSQRDLALRVGSTRQSVNGWETGRARPGAAVRERLAQVLGGDVFDEQDAPA